MGLSNLLNKHDVFRKMSTFPDFIFFAKETIKKEFSISAVEFREPKKNNQKQPLHIDWLPRKKRSDKMQREFFKNSNLRWEIEEHKQKPLGQHSEALERVCYYFYSKAATPAVFIIKYAMPFLSYVE